MEKKIVEVGGLKLGKDSVIIAGPCSIESKEHIMEEARALSQMGVHILRGGAYKPRTSYESFKGLGYEAAVYLREAGNEYNLPVITEVMSEYDIERLYPLVDIFQVGSRNMYNYALLERLGKQDKPVLLKRGFSATTKEWIGASQYILAGGNEGVIFCERGIRGFDPSFRNTLDLAGAALVQRETGRPTIVDPSHATGRKDMVIPLAKASLAMGLDGIMVEVHPRPDEALSDGDQSLDYQAFEDLMNQVKIREY